LFEIIGKLQSLALVNEPIIIASMFVPFNCCPPNRFGYSQ
jgi:hypothetical protein